MIKHSNHYVIPASESTRISSFPSSVNSSYSNSTLSSKRTPFPNTTLSLNPTHPPVIHHIPTQSSTPSPAPIEHKSTQLAIYQPPEQPKFSQKMLALPNPNPKMLALPTPDPKVPPSQPPALPSPNPIPTANPPPLIQSNLGVQQIISGHGGGGGGDGGNDESNFDKNFWKRKKPKINLL
jgi:hypothetical protein